MAIFRKIPAGDIQITGGQMSLVSGADYLRLKLLARHRFFKGEWFRDTRQGFPWFEIVFVKNPDLEIIRSAYRQMLLTTPSVLSVPKLLLVPDYEERSLGFDFVVKATDATVIVSPNDDDFIVRYKASD